jgi:site-specific recombinase XerD
MRVELELQHIQHWVDHLGRKRYRFRRRGYPRVELPVNSDPNSPEFQAAYHAAMRGEKLADALSAVAARGGSGTVNNAITQYLASTTFNDDYVESTKSLRRPMLNSVSRLVGTLPLAKMDRDWIERWLETAPTRGVKRTRLLTLKPFLQWAVSMRLIAADPSAGITVKVKESSGHATWSDEQIAQYRAHHVLGTKARLAIELLLAVAARRGDGIALGRRHLKGGCLVFTQEKNRRRKPVTVEAPVPAELMAAIEACLSPPEALTFLTNEWGRPFGKKAFNAQFRKWCDEAGLPQSCKPHGLRKAACRIMAESDCTVHEIKSVSGHRTLREVERYTAAVDNKRLAIRARAKVAAANNVVPLAVVAGK